MRSREGLEFGWKQMMRRKTFMKKQKKNHNVKQEVVPWSMVATCTSEE
jgi:hypothetical protein